MAGLIFSLRQKDGRGDPLCGTVFYDEDPPLFEPRRGRSWAKPFSKCQCDRLLWHYGRLWPKGGWLPQFEEAP